VSTIFGRRRFLRGISSVDSAERSRAERQAVNAIIQGSASDLIKYVMLQVERRLDADLLASAAEDRGLRPRIVMQIHDELIYEVPLIDSSCPPEQDMGVVRFTSFLSNLMTKEVVQELQIQVPLKTSISVGRDWGAMAKMEARVETPLVSASSIYDHPPSSTTSNGNHRDNYDVSHTLHEKPPQHSLRGKRSVD
jgi:DNA polymerase-1